MNYAEFVAKIEWEGGVLDALDYGLKHADLVGDDEITRDLRSVWAELERRYAEHLAVIARCAQGASIGSPSPGGGFPVNARTCRPSSRPSAGCEWAQEMIRTHRPTKCETCGLYAIWVPRKADPADSGDGRRP